MRVNRAALLRELAETLDCGRLLQAHPHLGEADLRRLLLEAAVLLEERGEGEEDALAVFVDGASRGNPGEAGIGVVIQRKGRTLATLSKYLGITTNNAAEYEALIHGLRLARKHLAAGPSGRPPDVRVYSDSELLVRQMTGQYRVRHPRLIPYHAEAQRLAAACGGVRYVHVPRERNAQADALANRAIDEKRIPSEGSRR